MNSLLAIDGMEFEENTTILGWITMALEKRACCSFHTVVRNMDMTYRMRDVLDELDVKYVFPEHMGEITVEKAMDILDVNAFGKMPIKKLYMTTKLIAWIADYIYDGFEIIERIKRNPRGEEHIAAKFVNIYSKELKRLDIWLSKTYVHGKYIKKAIETCTPIASVLIDIIMSYVLDGDIMPLPIHSKEVKRLQAL